MYTKQVLIACYLWLGELMVGYFMGWTSPMLPILQDITQTPLNEVITDSQATWIVSVIYIGSMIGPSISSHLANVVGRKPCLMLGSAITVVSLIIVIFAKNYSMLIVFRIVSGIGAAMIRICNILYIGEMASPNIRGRLLATSDIFSGLGCLLVYSIGPFTPYIYTGSIGLAIMTTNLVCLYFIPESPTYYTMTDQSEKAKVTLKYLGRENEIMSTRKTDSLENQTKEDSLNWKELFTVKSNRRSLFLTVSLLCLQQMSGAVAVSFYATTIFELAGSSIRSDIAPILLVIIQICTSTISSLCVEKLGRRILLIGSTAFTSLTMVVFGMYFYLDSISNPVVDKVRWLPLLCLAVFYLSYYSGFSILPAVLVGEMFTPNSRSLGATIGYITSLALGFCVTTAFGYIIVIASGQVAFWFFSATCACACLITTIFLPETKGKSLQEIQDIMSK